MIGTNSAEAVPQSSSSSIPMSVSSSSSTTAITTKIKIKDILRKVNRWQTIHSKFEKNIPFVSVTYAQTLDGMIATRTVIQDDDGNDSNSNSHVEENSNDDNHNNELKKKDDIKNSHSQNIHIDTNNNNKMNNCSDTVSSNLQLSCKESFRLTHALRSIHDGILIGGNTLLHDNPRLNNRLWYRDDDLNDTNVDANEQQQQQSLLQPVPIILDTHLKYVMKMIHSKQKDTTETIRAVKSHDKIIICCSEDAYKSHNEEIQSIYKCNTIHLLKCKMNEQKIEFGDNNNNGDGKQELELKGGGLKIESVLQNLRSEHDIQSVMVEGGSSILSSFLSKADEFVDCVCVTIVPQMIGGEEGLLSLRGCNLIQKQNGDVLKGLEFDPLNISWSTVGCDCIFLASN